MSQGAWCKNFHIDVLLQDCGTPLLLYWSNRCLALTHCNLVIPYVDLDVGPHWFR